MKKLLLTTLTAAAVLLAGCGDDPKVSATGVTIEPTLTLEVGAVRTLTATVQPTDATNQTVNYVSNATGVAMVNGDKLTAVAVGVATITAITEDGSHTAECKVTVIPVQVPATGVSLNHETHELMAGKTLQLEAILEPAGATTELLWASSDNAIAIVNPTGLVTARTVGAATITVTAVDGGHTANCVITVNENTVSVTSIKSYLPAKTLAPGGLSVIKINIEPANATDHTVTAVSSDPTVATVTPTATFIGSGAWIIQHVYVTALKDGATTITLTTANGLTTTTPITVTTPNNFLGDVAFKSDRVWKVGNQEWSDAVTATGCNKSTYDAGGPGNNFVFTIDCRSIGDLNYYSFEMVNAFKNTLCPDGWRVPSTEDFCTLDKTLNNRSDCRRRSDDGEGYSNYMNSEKWGGTLTGMQQGQSFSYGGTSAAYWSSTPFDSDNGYYLLISSNVAVFPEYSEALDSGMPVRCVRDVQ